MWIGPLTRCRIRRSTLDRSWASLATRIAASHHVIGQTVRVRLSQDLRDALEKARQPELTLDLGVEVFLGIILQVAAANGEGRLDDRDRPDAVRCMLAAIGVGRRTRKDRKILIDGLRRTQYIHKYYILLS